MRERPLTSAVVVVAATLFAGGCRRAENPKATRAPLAMPMAERAPELPTALPPLDDRCVRDDDCAYSEWVPGHCCKACAHGASRTWAEAMATACAGRAREAFERCFPCQSSFGGHGPCLAGRCAPPQYPEEP